MIIFIMCALLITDGGGAQLTKDNCSTGELKACVELMPSTPVGLASNIYELDAQCQPYQTGMICLDALFKRCLPTDGQKLVQKQIGGARTLMRFLCTNDTILRREYLKEPTCWGEVSSEWTRCVGKLQSAVKESTERVLQPINFDRNLELCCARDVFDSCVSDAGRSCSSSSSLLLRRMAWVLAQDVTACVQQPKPYCNDAPSLFVTPLLAILTSSSYILLYYKYS